MTRSKKIFLGFAIVFFGSLCYLVYDISSRTTFPGRSKQRMEQDSTANRDTLKSSLPPKSAVHQP